VKVDVAGIQKVVEKLEGIKTRVRNLSPVLQVVIEDLVKFQSDTFRSGKRDPATGEPWAALTAGTVTKKAKAGKEQILVWSNRMSKPSTRADAADGSVIIGSNIPYAKHHQFGTRKMPARPFLPSSSWRDGSPQASLMLKIYARVRTFVRTGKTAANG